MRRDEMYQSIGFTLKRRTCTEKERYSYPEDAQKAAYEYDRRVVFGGMNAYRCDRHGCWHIGHHDKRRKAQMKMLEDILWFKAWARGN